MINQPTADAQRSTATLPAIKRPCGHCGAENLTTDHYCAGCGKSLWQKCPGCTRRAWVGDKFCGGCGKNLEAVAEQKASELRRLLRGAAEAASQLDFLEAAQLAQRVATSADARLAGLEDEAQRLYDEYNHTHHALIAQRDKVVPEARVAAMAGNRQRVIELLSEIPEHMLAEAERTLLAQNREQLAEVEELRGSLKEAIDAKDWLELGHRLTRWLALCPEDAWGQEIAAKVSRALVENAAKRLQAGSVAQCAERLDAVPPAFRDQNYDKLVNQLEEIRWLRGELRSSLAVHGGLVRFASRLAKMLPNDEELQKVEAHIEKLQRTPPATPADLFPSWPGRDHSWTEVHVAHWGRYPKLEAQRPPALQRHPTQFAVALGLALQGLGEVDQHIHLMPQRGLLNRLMSGRPSRANAAWGLDLGTAAVKLVRLVRQGKTGIAMETAEILPYELPLSHPTVQSRITELVGQKLKQIRDKHDLGNAPVVVSIPTNQTLGRFSQIPGITGRKREELIKREASMQMPLALEQLAWAWHTPEVSPDVEFTNYLQMVAVRNLWLESQQNLLKLYKIQPLAFQAAPIALHHAMRWHWAEQLGDPLVGSDSTPRRVVIGVDLGAEATTLVISAADRFWFRSVGVAGDEYSRAMARTFRRPMEEVEQLKPRIPEMAPLFSLYQQFDAISAQLRERIERSLEDARRLLGRLAPIGIYLTGGGSLLHGTLERLFYPLPQSMDG